MGDLFLLITLLKKPECVLHPGLILLMMNLSYFQSFENSMVMSHLSCTPILSM